MISRFASSRGFGSGKTVYGPLTFPNSLHCRVIWHFVPAFLNGIMIFSPNYGLIQPWGVPTWRSPAPKRARRRRNPRHESHALQPHRWRAKAERRKDEGKRCKRRVRKQSRKTRDRSVRCKILFLEVVPGRVEFYHDLPWLAIPKAWNGYEMINECQHEHPNLELDLSCFFMFLLLRQENTWTHSVGLVFFHISIWSAFFVSAPIHWRFRHLMQARSRTKPPVIEEEEEEPWVKWCQWDAGQMNHEGPWHNRPSIDPYTLQTNKQEWNEFIMFGREKMYQSDTIYYNS